jgi:hypothetical protein
LYQPHEIRVRKVCTIQHCHPPKNTLRYNSYTPLCRNCRTCQQRNQAVKNNKNTWAGVLSKGTTKEFLHMSQPLPMCPCTPNILNCVVAWILLKIYRQHTTHRHFVRRTRWFVRQGTICLWWFEQTNTTFTTTINNNNQQ